MGGDLERVSLTIPSELLAELDEVITEWEYSSRSEAVRDALRAFLSDYRWRTGLSGAQHGAVTILYDHDVKGLNDELLQLQHEVPDTIVSSQHVHLSDHLCLETLVVDGTGEEIKKLVNRIQSLRGIKQVKLAVL